MHLARTYTTVCLDSFANFVTKTCSFDACCGSMKKNKHTQRPAEKRTIQFVRSILPISLNL